MFFSSSDICCPRTLCQLNSSHMLLNFTVEYFAHHFFLHFTGPESVCLCSNFLKMCQIHWEKKVALWLLTCCGACCVSPHRPLWRHWCYPEACPCAPMPRRPPAAAARWLHRVQPSRARCSTTAVCPQRTHHTAHSQLILRPCGTLPSGLTSAQLLFNLETCQKTPDNFEFLAVFGSKVAFGEPPYKIVKFGILSIHNCRSRSYFLKL